MKTLCHARGRGGNPLTLAHRVVKVYKTFLPFLGVHVSLVVHRARQFPGSKKLKEIFNSVCIFHFYIFNSIDIFNSNLILGLYLLLARGDPVVPRARVFHALLFDPADLVYMDIATEKDVIHYSTRIERG